MIRRWVVLLLVAGALSLGGAAAWAYWSAGVVPGGSGAAQAAVVNAATTPTVSKYAAQAVRLTWPAVTLSQGTAVAGYVVTRYNATTMATTPALTGCAGTVTALTCTETAVPAGSWRYSVHAVIGANWTGAESTPSTVVATAPATLTLAQTYFRGPFPATTTGTVAGFGVNEAFSYSLDAGISLTGFPTVVDVTGGAPISSLSLPAAAEGPHTVTVTGANGSSASTTIIVDTVAPVPSAVLSPAANGTGWNTSAPVQVTLSAVDGTSGVATIRYTLDGTDPTVSGTAVTYTGPFSVNATTTVRYVATDLAGNVSTVAVQAVKIDTVAPVNALTLSGATGAALSGTTIYYRGTTAGGFTITNALTDAGSGPASSRTSALAGTATGFTHTPSTVSTPAGGPYVSAAFSFAAGTGSTPTETVTGTDVAGNTATTVLTLTPDVTGPAGGSVDATGLVGTDGRYSTSTTLSIAFAKGTDAGVGLAASGAVLQRATATLSNGVCGTYGTAVPVATDPASPRADTVADQACHRYEYVVADALGNSTTYTGGDVKVDTTAPTTPTFAYTAGANAYVSGTTLYYRSTSAGSFTVTASSTDPASGISGYAFPALGTNWSSVAGATGVRTYSWTNPAAAPAGTSVTVTNNATRTASAAMNLVDDITAPSGGSTSYAAGYVSSASVPVTFSAGTDAGSGVNAGAGLLQRRSATLTSPLGTCGATYSAWATIATGPTSPYTDTTVATSTCYQYQYVAADNLGNQATPYAGPNTVKVPAYFTCASAVLATTPDEYYRLSETSGTTAVDSSGNARNATYTGGYTQGVVGACGTGVTLNGSTGHVFTSAQFSAPTTYTAELWFRTTTAQGGKLIGFGNQSSAQSSAYDRHIWMSQDGKLNFGTTTGVLLTNQTNITSGSAYRDGVWHHAAATQSSAGMRLYVDGVQVATSNVTTAQNYNGYWRIGYDNLAGWYPLLNAGSDFFAGSVSNVAVYNTKALTAAQVWDHYIAGAVSSGAVITAPASVSASSQAAGQASGLSVRPGPKTAGSATTPRSTPPAGSPATSAAATAPATPAFPPGSPTSPPPTTFPATFPPATTPAPTVTGSTSASPARAVGGTTTSSVSPPADSAEPGPAGSAMSGLTGSPSAGPWAVPSSGPLTAWSFPSPVPSIPSSISALTVTPPPA